MTSLAPAGQHVESLRALIEQVGAENVMDLDAAKESSYVASCGRRRGCATATGLHRWAILDGSDTVVGYLSGRFAGGIPGRELSNGAIAGFISLIVVAEEARGAGHGWHAIREFARLARDERSTTEVALRVDETGDVERRRARFRRMGFEFEGLFGCVSVDVLLAGDRGSVPNEPRSSLPSTATIELEGLPEPQMSPTEMPRLGNNERR